MSNDLKAYIISDKWNNCSTVEFAQSAGKAKAQAQANNRDLFDGYEYVELIAYRDKDFDKYAKAQKIPIQALLKKGWWFWCSICGAEGLNQDYIDHGRAFIINDLPNDDELIDGSIICLECKKKLKKEAENE